ncbi:MAG TPA: glycosyltransferase family 9 protein [Chitinophagales bacterium]|nr:glycosyltransferase family 9 protein [Chitinophagales bacterium]
MKFLILRFSSIGDIVLTTPVVRCLRKAFPEAEIHYATKKAFAPIIAANPNVSKVHVLEGSISDLVKELKQEQFDYAIDLHHNQRTQLIKWQLGVKSFSFNKLNVEKWLMVNFKVNKLPPVHIVDRYLATCAALGVENDGEGLDYFTGKNDIVDIRSLPEGFAGGYVAWVIGAKQNTKKFPAEKIIETLKGIDYPVMLLGGKEDEKEAAQIYDALKGKTIYNACGKYKLNQSASLVQQARLVVSNDTGLMHIAAAFKKPVISIWGNTIPAFGMYPYYGKHIVPNERMEVDSLPCRPCSKLGYAECPQGHFNCMKLQKESRLADTIKQMWEVC